MTHLMHDELIRWRDEGFPAERDRVLSHLASCEACAEAYAELIRTSPAAETLSHFNPADFVARGYAARRNGEARSWTASLTSWKVWAGALSAAALATLVVLVVPDLRRGVEPGDVSRGAGIELVMPSPRVAPTTLEWKNALTGVRFRVELTDSHGARLYQMETDASRVALPPDVVARIRPGSYKWSVTALDKDGQPVTTSSGTFSIEGLAR
jgi:hypothetical protein